MRSSVVPLTDFQHGRTTFREGVPADVDTFLAEDLEKRGLVRVRDASEPARPPVPEPRTREAPPRRTQEAPPHRTQVVPDPEPGKARADGQGTPSASLPLAQASSGTMLVPLKRGPGRPRKIVT